MGRPRKMTVEQMISVVDSYYYAQAERNEKRMKCYAKVEADDYEYNKVVTAYKNLDVTAFIRNNKEHLQLVKPLSELDARWKRVYEHADVIAKQNKKLLPMRFCWKKTN